MNHTCITHEQLKQLHSLDEALYPNSMPFETLASWHRASPAACFRAIEWHGQARGFIVALLLPGDVFDGLLSGHLQESDVTAEHIQRARSGSHVARGMHFWHVERTQVWSAVTSMRFSDVLKQYMAEIADLYGVTRFSALTASKAGEQLFANKLGFHVTGTYDFVYAHDAKQFVLHLAPGDVATVEGTVIISCKFMAKIL